MALTATLARALTGAITMSPTSSGWAGTQNTTVATWVGTFDADGLRLNDTYNNGTTRARQPGRAKLFNGTNQGITTATNLPASKTTLVCELWAYLDTASGLDQTLIELSTYYWGDQGRIGVWWSLTGHDNKICMGLKVVHPEQVLAVTPAVTTGWYHIVVSWDIAAGPTYPHRIWLNGAKQTLTDVATSSTTISAFAQLPFYVGARDGGASVQFANKLAGVRVIYGTTPWSDNACAQLYTEALSGPQNYANTHLWLKLDGSGQTLEFDSSGNNNHGTIVNYTSGMDYTGTDVPYSWQNEVGYSAYTDGVGTNLVASPDASQSVTNFTLTANSAYSPKLGTLVADTYMETADNGQHVIGASDAETIASTAANTPLIASFDICGIGRTVVYVSINNAAISKYVWAYFTFSNLTATAAGNVTWLPAGLRITSLGAGWYRCEIGAIVDAGNTDIRVRVIGQNGGYSYAGDVTKGYYVCNKTLKIGSLLTPRDESDVTKDILGNSLQYSGRCPIRPKLANSNCLTLNGTDQYVDCGTGTWSTDGTEAMDVSLLFRSTDTVGTMVGMMLTPAPYNGWQLILESAGNVGFYLVNSITSNAIQTHTVQSFNDDTWHLARLTYDGSKSVNGVAIYIDGIRQALVVEVNNLSGSSASPSAGARFGSTEALQLFAGSLCDVSITIGANTWKYPLAEGLNSTVYNTVADANHGTIGNYTSDCWTTLQSVYHHNILRGYTLASGVRKPARNNSTTLDASGNALTNPPRGHNDAETEFDFRGDTASDPYIALVGGTVPTTHTRGDSLPATFTSRLAATNEDIFRAVEA